MLLKKIAITVVCLATTATYHHLNALHTNDDLQKRTVQERINKDRAAVQEVRAKQDDTEEATRLPQVFTPEEQQQVIALINRVLNQ